MSPREKLQDTPNIPHKISYMILFLKFNLGLTGSPKNVVRNHEFHNFHLFLRRKDLQTEFSYKRKNLEFQMLAAVYHKGDHGQYCYTLK